MLTIPIEVIADLLDKASEVDFTVFEIDEDGEVMDAAGAGLAADPACRELAEAIEELNPDEVYELLALAQLGSEESEIESWDEAAAEARTIPENATAEELIRVLVLSDAIESALERLGYAFEDEEGDDADEEDEEEQEDEDEDDKDEEADEEAKGGPKA